MRARDFLWLVPAGIALIVIMDWRADEEARIARESVRTQARIEALHADMIGTDSADFSADYTFDLQGETHRARGVPIGANNHDAWSVGDRIEVWVMPDDPSETGVVNRSNMAPVWVGRLLGGVLIAGGLIGFEWRRRNPG
ncbi:DUF3592 domain-containing protein [Roseovarius salinarum]|uniref:DUF3592 domain-containing protein n=1 Tax=Roseovarius salinarum TaxID=1981892 RepID=UPI0012FFFE22|nr:DUF3592 domain-containing protein [Roseovarius salinarum]